MNYKRWVFIAITLFAIGIIIGVVTPAGVGLPAEYIAGFKELGRFLVPFSPLTLIFIFIKNVSALLISFVFSPILCLIPVLSLAANGWLVGFVSESVVQEKSLGFLLAGLLPHGVFELPAFILGQAAALSFGAMVILALFRKGRRSQLMPNLKQNLRYLAIACVLLLLAAVIETYVTPLLLT